jgi:hypothetical protein
MSEKMTKRDMYARIAEVAGEAGYEDIVEFANKEIVALETKAEKARERAAAKVSEVDDLEAAVANALTDELQTGQAIFEAVDTGDEEFATIGKVRARLTKLVKAEVAVKEDVKEDKRTVKAYRLA